MVSMRDIGWISTRRKPLEVAPEVVKTLEIIEVSPMIQKSILEKKETKMIELVHLHLLCQKSGGERKYVSVPLSLSQ